MHVDEAAVAGILGFFCVLVAIALTILIFYLLTLQKALNRVSPRNRLMEPGLVWLSLIPFFNLIWAFFIAMRVPDSLANEFRARRRDDRSDYGKTIGIVFASLSVANMFLSFAAHVAPPIQLISGPLGLASLVLFIIFWVKIANYSNQLGDVDPRLEYGDDDYHDDRDDRRGGDDWRLENRGRDRDRAVPPDAIRPDDRGEYR